MSKKTMDETKNTLDNDIQDISIEEIDKEMNDFYIDKEKVDSIKAPPEMRSWVSESIDRAEKDMKKEKIRKYFIRGAASVGIILSIGIYSPALAHFMPPVQKILEDINRALKVEEIADFTGINQIIPNVTIDKNNKVKFDKSLEEDKTANEESSKEQSNQYMYARVPDNRHTAIEFIHKMANSIINPTDGLKYGQIEITPQNIDIAIEGLKYVSEMEGHSHIHDELIKWKNGDFSNGVELHNYVWDLLDGTIGKAKSLDHEEIRKIKEKHFSIEVSNEENLGE